MPAGPMELGRVQLRLPGGGTVAAVSFHPALPPKPAEPPANPTPVSPAVAKGTSVQPCSMDEPAAAAKAAPPPALAPASTGQRAGPAYRIALVEAAPCTSRHLVQTLLEVAGDLHLRAVALQPECEQPTGAHLVLTHLGCRWAPRLFQPVITQADAIWLVAPPNSWPAVEMRLDQAEFSGWTDMAKVEIITLGQGAPPPPDIEHLVAATLLDPSGPAARGFLTRFCGRVKA